MTQSTDQYTAAPATTMQSTIKSLFLDLITAGA